MNSTDPRSAIQPWLVACLLAAALPVSSAAATCDAIRTMSFVDTTINVAQVVPAGSFTTPRNTTDVQQQLLLTNLPAFCRVAATLRPTSDSEIHIEVWMPALGWNGKFMGVGNGIWRGSIPFAAMGPMLTRGYAVAATDTGHLAAGTDASFALGHPEKLVDFGYRAVNLMTLRAKDIVKAFYSSAPRYSYWSGCSSGGKQGLKEAQKFPEDYDGIIAGAPSNWWPIC